MASLEVGVVKLSITFPLNEALCLRYEPVKIISTPVAVLLLSNTSCNVEAPALSAYDAVNMMN
jgi:hypothetical protein